MFWGRPLKRSSTFFGAKKCTPEKILATPINLTNPWKKSCGRPCNSRCSDVQQVARKPTGRSTSVTRQSAPPSMSAVYARSGSVWNAASRTRDVSASTSTTTLYHCAAGCTTTPPTFVRLMSTGNRTPLIIDSWADAPALSQHLVTDAFGRNQKFISGDVFRPSRPSLSSFFLSLPSFNLPSLFHEQSVPQKCPR